MHTLLVTLIADLVPCPSIKFGIEVMPSPRWQRVINITWIIASYRWIPPKGNHIASQAMAENHRWLLWREGSGDSQGKTHIHRHVVGPGTKGILDHERWCAVVCRVDMLIYRYRCAKILFRAHQCHSWWWRCLMSTKVTSWWSQEQVAAQWFVG